MKKKQSGYAHNRFPGNNGRNSICTLLCRRRRGWLELLQVLLDDVTLLTCRCQLRSSSVRATGSMVSHCFERKQEGNAYSCTFRRIFQFALGRSEKRPYRYILVRSVSSADRHISSGWQPERISPLAHILLLSYYDVGKLGTMKFFRTPSGSERILVS